MAVVIYGNTTTPGEGGAAQEFTQLKHHLNLVAALANQINGRFAQLSNAEAASAYGVPVGVITALQTSVTDIETKVNAGEFAKFRFQLVSHRG